MNVTKLEKEVRLLRDQFKRLEDRQKYNSGPESLKDIFDQAVSGDIQLGILENDHKA